MEVHLLRFPVALFWAKKSLRLLRLVLVDLMAAIERGRTFETNVSLVLDRQMEQVSYTYFLQKSLTSYIALRKGANLRSDTPTALMTADTETPVPTTIFTPSSYRLIESGFFRSEDSHISFADS